MSFFSSSRTRNNGRFVALGTWRNNGTPLFNVSIRHRGRYSSSPMDVICPLIRVFLACASAPQAAVTTTTSFSRSKQNKYKSTHANRHAFDATKVEAGIALYNSHLNVCASAHTGQVVGLGSRYVLGAKLGTDLNLSSTLLCSRFVQHPAGGTVSLFPFPSVTNVCEG